MLRLRTLSFLALACACTPEAAEIVSSHDRHPDPGVTDPPADAPPVSDLVPDGGSPSPSPPPPPSALPDAAPPAAGDPVPRSGGYVTDRNAYPLPALPALPAAGGTFRDPTFGTLIMRLTDAADGPDNQVAYAYWPTFNKDSTRISINTAQGFTLYRLDKRQFTLIDKQAVPISPTGSILFEDAIWSGSNPDVIYGHTLTGRIYAYNAATRAYTLIKDLNAALPGEYQWQMSMSLDDNVFAFTRRDASTYAVRGYVVWRRSTDQLVIDAGPPQGVDEVHLDKTGRYLFVNTPAQGAGIVEGNVRDLVTGTITQLMDNGPDFNPSHYDLGSGTIIGDDNWNNRLTKRDLSNPHAFTTVLDMGSDWTLAEHSSFLGNDESWALVSFYIGEPPGVFRGEIVQYRTDGSQQVRRLAHHRSTYVGYYDTPRANITRDGCFVAFASNWGAGGRHDVFVLNLAR